MYEIIYTVQFRRQVRKCKRRGLDISRLTTAVNLLQNTGTLPQHYHPHKLSGEFRGYWECHIQPDWLLVWLQDDQRLILVFTDTGSHADLFGN